MQCIIETLLDASAASFEEVSARLRANERYQFIFAADFPNGYDRRAIDALQSLSKTGPTAGTYLVLQHNRRHELLRDVSMEGFLNSYQIDAAMTEGSYTTLGLKLKLDEPPAPDLQTKLFAALSAAKPPERAVDWDTIGALPQNHWWQESSSRIVETPIGARGNGNKLNRWFGVKNQG